jgi:ComF family protein
MLRKLWTSILDLVYPPKCPVCRRVIEVHGAWCAKCLTGILSPREINLLTHRLTALDSCLAICEYEAGLKRLLHDMKFRQQERYALHLRWILYKGLQQRKYKIDCDLVVPVPLHKDRLAERGYNQTALLFKEWAQRQGLRWCEDVLVRRRATEAQWKLGLSERKRNIKGAFYVTRPAEVIGKRILLVDDIFTSGVTLEECAKVLKQADCREVSALVLASGAQ